MAIADLLVTVIIMPYTVVFLYVQFRWFGGIFGDIMCKLVNVSLTTSIAASIFTLIVMTFDRFVSIVFIWKQNLTLRSSKSVIFTIWFFAISLMGVYLAVYKVVKVGDQFVCVPDWSFAPIEFPKYFAVGLFLVLYAVPLILMAVMYTFIILYLKKDSLPSGCTDSNIRNSKERVVKMLISITITFAVCWFPLHLNHYFIYFDLAVYRCLPFYVTALSFFIGHANSAVNPVVYVFFNNSFRRAIKDTFGIRLYESAHLQTNTVRRSRAHTNAATKYGSARNIASTTRAAKRETISLSTSLKQRALMRFSRLPKSTRSQQRYSTLVVYEKVTSL